MKRRKINLQLRCGGLLLMTSRVVSYPKHGAVSGILCWGRSTGAPWPYWWPPTGCDGGGSSGRPGPGRQTCSLRLRSGRKPELLGKERKMKMSGKHEPMAGFHCGSNEWHAERPASELSDNKAFTTSPVECALNIICRGEKIARQVKGRWIISWHSVIIHSGAVEVVTPLTVHLPMSCIYNVSDPQLPQAVAIVGHWPVDEQRLLWNAFAGNNLFLISDLHVTNEQVWPNFIHVIAKSFSSIQNLD